MAKLTEEDKAAAKAAAAEAVQAEKEAAQAETEGLVAMTKAHEFLHVHPTAVKGHEDAGWSVA